MGLWIHDSGASTAEIKAGIAAAEARMKRFKHDPAFIALVLRDETAGPGDAQRAREVWADAERVAFEAAFKGWARWPEGASLVWERPDD